MQTEEKRHKFDRIRINEKSIKILDWLTDELKGKMSKDNIKLLIFAKGIKSMPLTFKTSIEENHEPISTTMRFDTFIHPVMEGIVRQKNRKSLLTNEDRRLLYERYFEYGANVLQNELREKAKGNIGFWLFKKNLPIIADSKKTIQRVNRGNNTINILLGVDNRGEEVFIHFNNASQAGFHVGILGTTGSGKTQKALSIISQIHSQSPNTNVLFFDYAKGDVANNTEFINDISANVIDISEDGIPFNPFILNGVNDKKINELASLLISNQSSVGTNQTIELYNILKELYDTEDGIDFYMVFEAIKERYENKANSLVYLFHQFSIPGVFPERHEKDNINSFMNDNYIFNLSKIDQTVKVKELITFLILHNLYSEAIKMKDSFVSENGIQEIRTVVVIDEGHNYLNAKNPIFEKMLRELRSKGISIITLTQSYQDMKVDGFDYTSLMNWTFFMKQKITPKLLAEGLGLSTDIVKKLPDFLSLPTHASYIKSIRKKDAHITFIQSNPYGKGFKTT